MNHRPSFRTPRFKPAAKLAFVAPPKPHLYWVTLTNGFEGTTPTPTTRQGAYRWALAECIRMVTAGEIGFYSPLWFVPGCEPLVESIVEADPVLDRTIVPVWFVEKLMAEKRARITAEAAEIARQAALPIPPMPAKRNLFTPTDPEPVDTDFWFDVETTRIEIDEADTADYEALMGSVAEFAWTADEMGFNAWGYRSGFSVVS